MPSKVHGCWSHWNASVFSKLPVSATTLGGVAWQPRGTVKSAVTGSWRTVGGGRCSSYGGGGGRVAAAGLPGADVGVVVVVGWVTSTSMNSIAHVPLHDS